MLFAVCLAAFVGVSATNMVQGNSLIWLPDGEALYFNFFVYEGELLRNLLGSIGQPDFAVPQYTFDGGYGTDLFGLMAGCLNDPFNLLSVFVSPCYAEYAFEALVFVRFFLAAVTFSLYCFSRGAGKSATLCGSLCYVLGGFVVVWGVLRHPNFINVAILLPLVFYGADRVFQKKSPALLIVAMALQFFFSVYFSYMTLLVLVVYCLVKYCFAVRRKSVGDFFLLVGRFVLYLLCTALIAGIAVVPIVLMLTSMGRVGVTREISLFDSFAFYWQYASNMIGGGSMRRGLVLGAVPLAGALLLVVAGKTIDHRKRMPWLIGLALCFLGSLTPYFGSLMNGFGYATDRWMVVFSFCASYAVVLAIPVLGRFSRRQWAAFAALGAFLFVWAFAYGIDDGSRRYLMMAMLFAVVVVVVVIAGRRASQSVIAGTLSCFAVAGMVLIVFSLSGVAAGFNDLGEYQKAGGAYDRSRTIPLGETLASLDADYRIDRADTAGMRNQAFAQGFKGVDFFSSFYNQSIDDFRQSLGIADNHTNYIFNGHDQRFAIDNLLGARYFIAADETPRVPFGYELVADLGEGADGRTYGLYESDLALPLAFVYDDAVTQDDFDGLGPIERQDLLTRACVIEGLAASSTSLETSNVVDQTVTVRPKKGVRCEDGEFKVYRENAKVVIEVEGVSSAENVLVFDNLVMTPLPPSERVDLRKQEDASGKDIGWWDQLKWRPERSSELTVKAGDAKKKIKITNSLHAGYGGKTDWAINMGYSQEPVTKYVIKFQRCGTYTFDGLFVSSQKIEGTVANIEKLQADNAASVSFGTNAISVDVAAEKDGGGSDGADSASGAADNDNGARNVGGADGGDGADGTDDARYVFLSVPYSPGWSATVDGQPAEILKANVGFMALEVNGDAHDIQLTYMTPGLVAGAWCSLAGIALFVGILLVRRKVARQS